jgi:hypothetical protein
LIASLGEHSKARMAGKRRGTLHAQFTHGRRGPRGDGHRGARRGDCDGSAVTAHEAFLATNMRDGTQTVDPQRAVGSPDPGQCTVKHLKVM